MLVRTLKKSAVLRALLYGALSGMVGVALFILLLKLPTETDGELLPTNNQSNQSDQTGQQEQFYARQYGVYSTMEGAAAFIGTAPSLNKAAIIQVEEQYFIWGSVAREKAMDAKPTIPSSFYKTFTLESSCPQQPLLQLPSTLKDEKWLKNLFEGDAKEASVPEDWMALIPEVQKLSDDVDVIRLHVLNHYYAQLDCLKITF
ncbi:MAG: translation initiation factor 2 [Solibacillus sp.]